MADFYTDSATRIKKILKVKGQYELKDLVTHFAVDATTCAACHNHLPRHTRTFWCKLKRGSEEDTRMIHRDLVLCAQLADPDDRFKL